jgi:hypothetical protein
LPGPIKRAGALISRLTTWYGKVVGTLVILTFSAHYGLSYLSHPADTDYYIDKAFILGAFGTLLVGFLIRDWGGLRRERYAYSFDQIEGISASLRDLNTYLGSSQSGDQPEKLVRRELTSILDRIRELFSMLTGTRCRVAIKCLFSDNEEIFIYAVTRDSRSNEINARNDKERLEKRCDTLKDNDDFHLIFEEQARWFIENNLPRKRNYRNSSFKLYGEPPSKVALLRDFGWTLPYRATMVFPIQQRDSENLSFEPGGCIGFLAVDSGSPNVFKDAFDGPLGASLANALFAPLSKYVALLDKSGGEESAHG